MESNKFLTNDPSNPICRTTPKLTSENKTPNENLTTLIKEHEAKISHINLRLSEMEQRIKDFEDALVGVDAIDHIVQVLEDKASDEANGNTDIVQKHLKPADALKKQKNMYRALGINPTGVGL
ncbi:hypothetical protein DSL72_001827 [Monilinia vaccinii-corymbosi]|uniref:Uncharacterized protein n=1 Tax=Monilinia vaccinii-corymbosi TaxID=61207 RepID=A0A8A3PAX2_9HELO|nr:hypothetical protein DSL72_001827 [Monilinia vaccinii-corymbosi]